MCECNNIKIGSYNNTIILENPFYPSNSQKEFITIDKCLKNEILFLWANGIQTLNSCCGHNKVNGSIIVLDEHIDKMYDLGYNMKVIQDNTKLENCFYSKSCSVDMPFLRDMEHKYGFKVRDDLTLQEAVDLGYNVTMTFKPRKKPLKFVSKRSR